MFIGGDLDIIDNDFILIFDDLFNLKMIGGDFDFRDNVDDIGFDVVSFEGFNSLEFIGGVLFILNFGMKNIIGF